ncbi:LacI family DNA-binding transcriptional regulator [Neobacillus muris]|uniref:LacI family DNA-binding transcriptional regulator n=1 Tax=Neobacillus muris TaxID=2941334 RepID=UPI00203D8445|nr:LacI family DNA-binding transcriptional regulator [Neobacillus muris]
MKVTVEEVAKHAGVSRATAARILGGYAGERSKSRTKVLEAAEELGYFPNKLAKGLASSRSFKIGIIIPDIENLYFAKLYRGIQSVCHQNGFSLSLGISGEDEAIEQNILKELLSEQVEGIIIAPSNGLKQLTQCPIPVISVDRVPDSDQYSWVSSDNYESSFRAVEHLYKQGYKDIALLMNLPHLSTVNERWSGIRDACNHLMLPLTEHITTSHQLEKTVLEVKECLAKTQPDVVISTDSVLCTAVLLAANDLQIELGKNLGLISYDDEPWMTLVNPSITTIKQPVVEMGEHAAQQLLEQLSNPTTKLSHQRLKNELIIRNSTIR